MERGYERQPAMDKDEWLSRYFSTNLFNGVNLAFVHCDPDRNRHAKPQGTVLLIHGFPETSYVWRSVIPILTEHGYRVLAPDYRGAGESSKPTDGFTKASMALDMVMLLDERDIHEPVHVVGHNIGASIAFTLASRWPERVASLCLAECLLPARVPSKKKSTNIPTNTSTTPSTALRTCRRRWFREGKDLHTVLHQQALLPSRSLLAGCPHAIRPGLFAARSASMCL